MQISIWMPIFLKALGVIRVWKLAAEVLLGGGPSMIRATKFLAHDASGVLVGGSRTRLDF